MSSFTDYTEAAVLNHVFRGIAMTSPGTVYLALMTAAPNDTGGGTEVGAVGGYVRHAAAFDAPVGNTISNTDLESWVAAGGNFGNIVAVGVFDALTGGNMLSWTTITAALINDNDEIKFNPGDIVVSLD